MAFKLAACAYEICGSSRALDFGGGKFRYVRGWGPVAFATVLFRACMRLSAAACRFWTIYWYLGQF